MGYQSAYLWERGSVEAQSRVSLVLQQAVVKKQEVLMACVCESKSMGEQGVVESGYFTEGITEWFHRELLKLCERRGGMESLNKILHKEIERLQKEVNKYTKSQTAPAQLHFMVMVLWKKQFWMFHKGECEGYLLNRRFNKKHIKRIEGQFSGQQPVSINGTVQKKVSILLCTGNYFRYVKQEEAIDVLGIEEEITEQRMEKRLQELWQENVRRGECSSVGAVFLRS